jgi:hypothetical protein
MGKMTSVNSNQFGQERHVWRGKLERFKQKNVLLKYRLSEMVDSSEGSQFLQMAEYFQNELLLIDDKLRNLFFKLEELSSFPLQSKNGNELPNNIAVGYNKLKKDIFHFEKRFEDLSKEFNKKMSENTGS